MKRRISGGAFLTLSVLACSAWLIFYSDGEVERAAERVMQDELARGNFSGVALIARDGRLIFEKAYGLADVEWNVPNTTSTRFRIGSIAKSFTAVLVLQLEQQGKLTLADPICRYLDECPPGWSEITLHHPGTLVKLLTPEVCDSRRLWNVTEDYSHTAMGRQSRKSWPSRRRNCFSTAMTAPWSRSKTAKVTSSA